MHNSDPADQPIPEKTDADGTPALPTPKRRWFQFSLRTLLIFVSFFGVLLGWIAMTAKRVHDQRQIVQQIIQSGGKVYYDYQETPQCRIDITKSPPGPKILRWVFGDDLYAKPTVVWFSWEKPSDDRALTPLADLPELRALHLYGPGFTDKGVPRLRPLRRLRELNLSDTNISPEGLRQICDQIQLTTLSLLGQNISDEHLKAVNSCKSLRTLQITKGSITDSGLCSLEGCVELEQIDLFKNPKVTDKGIYALRKFKYLKVLRLLVSSLTDEGLRTIGKLRNLRCLNIGYHPISDEGLNHLSKLNRLESLDLSGTSISNAGMAVLEHFSKLQHLHLSSTNIDDDALKHIIPLKNLEVLNLSQTKISGAGLRRLKEMKNLKYLEVSVSDALTWEDAKALKKDLPRCHIIGWRYNSGGVGTLEFEESEEDNLFPDTQ